jgi:hypothetical protein
MDRFFPAATRRQPELKETPDMRKATQTTLKPRPALASGKPASTI